MQLGVRAICQLNSNVHTMLTGPVRFLGAGGQLLGRRGDQHRGIIDLGNQVAQIQRHRANVTCQGPDLILACEQQRIAGKISLGNGVH